MFTHFRYNVDCSPMPQLEHLYHENKINNANFDTKYPKMTSFDILMMELNATNMVDEGSDFSMGNSPQKGEI